MEETKHWFAQNKNTRECLFGDVWIKKLNKKIPSPWKQQKQHFVTDLTTLNDFRLCILMNRVLVFLIENMKVI